MTEPSLALQKAIRTRLIAAVPVTTLVPAANIIDTNGRPELFPYILLGQDQTVDIPRSFDEDRFEIFATLHVWAKETGLVLSKQIAGAVRAAIRTPGEWITVDSVALDMRFSGSRFIRDPDGEHSHGILTIQATAIPS